MDIATTAPSGRVGRHVTHALVRAGVRPRVLAHRPDSLDPGLGEHVDLHVVDLADPAATTAALEGVDAVFVTIPALFSDDPLADYDRFGTAISQMVTAAGVSRVVLRSSVGAELRHGAWEIDGLGAVEEALDATGAAVLHLRCAYFFTNLLLDLDSLRAGEVLVVLPTDRPMGWVAPVDIADVATSWLLRDDWTGRHVQAVHGPADLSWDDALAVVSEATGHHVAARRISDDDMRERMRAGGLGERQVEAILGMSTGLRDVRPEQPRDARITTPTTLRAWCCDVLRPALDG